MIWPIGLPVRKNAFPKALDLPRTATTFPTPPVSAKPMLSALKSPLASRFRATLRTVEVTSTFQPRISGGLTCPATDVATLSDRLCAPVGGVSPQVSSGLNSFYATNSASVTATPTIPPDVTAPSAVSSVFATATLTPDLGNPVDLNTYPLCAQICTNTTTAIGLVPGSETGNLEILCGATFRGLTAGCLKATCNDRDYTTSQLRGQQLCGSLYKNNATLSTSVSAAIASQTAIAIAATNGKNASFMSDYPQCAQPCITQNNYQGCGGIVPLCVCQGIEWNRAASRCQIASCGAEDLDEVLCEPLGGILTHPINYTSISNGTSNTPTTASSPLPFTGEGIERYGGSKDVGLMVMGVAVAVGVLMV
ncbi:MAG: hypothetical protein Q9186_004970 [Xanthomendoza sp. 1 TL-2023]